MLKLEEQFGAILASAPQRIKCDTQNMPITNFLTFEQTWNLPDDETFALRKIKLNSGHDSK